MNVFYTSFAAQLIFVLGIVNMITGLVLLSSCRWIPGSKLTAGLMKRGWYKSYYKYHAYVWWGFWTSVAVHVVFAVGRLGIPF